MTDPPRLLDGQEDLAARLLRTAELDRPPVGAFSSALRKAGLDGSAAVSTTAPATTGIAQASVLKAVVFCVTAGGLVGGAGDSVSRVQDRPAPVERAVVQRAVVHAPAPVVARVPPDSLAEPSTKISPSPDTPDVSPPRSVRERVGGRAYRQVPASLPSAAVESEPPSESANTGFADELALVDQARAELARGNARSVLTTIERYQARYPRGGFHPEMLALAVDALVLSGDRERARAASRRFLAQFPKHPLANRVQNQASK